MPIIELGLKRGHSAKANGVVSGLYVDGTFETKTNAFLVFQDMPTNNYYIKSIALHTNGNSINEKTFIDCFVFNRTINQVETITSSSNGVGGNIALSSFIDGLNVDILPNDANILKYGIMLQVYDRMPDIYELHSVKLVVEYETNESQKIKATNISPNGVSADVTNAIDISFGVIYEGIQINHSKVLVEYWGSDNVRHTKVFNTGLRTVRIDANTFPYVVGSIFYRILLTSVYGVDGLWSDVATFKINVFGKLIASGVSPNNIIVNGAIDFEWVNSLEVEDATQKSYTIEVLKSGGVWQAIKSDASSQTSYSLPSGVLVQSQYQWRVKCTSKYGESLHSKPLSFNVIADPIIENITIQGELWERSIIVNWRSEYQVGYEYECYYNNVKVLNGTGASEKTFTIPPNTFKGVLGSSVRIRVKNVIGGTVVWSDWLEKTFTLKDIEANISNLLVEGNKWEKPIRVSWLSTDQQQYKIEIFKSNVLQHTFTGATAKEHIIPKDILISGDYVFKVWVGYANRFVNYQTDNVTLTDIVATVGKVAVSGSNVDLPITVSWDSTDQEKYTLEVLQNSIVTHTFTGATAKAHTIQAGTLNVGLAEFRVKVAYKDRWTEYANTSTSLVETLPSISILEPDGRIVQRDEPLRVWWTSQNQTSWKLTVDRATEYTGTTTKEHIIQAGTLATGRHEMTLEVTLVIAGKTKKTYKTVEFIVQGKPPIPTITSGATFTTNRPTFAWDSQDATAYQVEVLGVYASGWLNGGDNTHKIADYLPNGSYTVLVRVKNQFNIISDEAVQQITINAVVPQAIALKVYDNYSYNVLRWVATGYDKYYVFRNDEMIGVSYSDSFTDYTAQGKNVYKVQGVTSTDTFSSSNEVVAYTDLDYPIISIGATMLEMKYSTSKVELNGSYSTMESKEYYAGRKQPIARHGEHEDMTYSFDYSEFAEENYTKLLDMVKLKQPILYRSKKHKLWLAFNSVGFVDNSMVFDYSVNAYVIDANEGIKYD